MDKQNKDQQTQTGITKTNLKLDKASKAFIDKFPIRQKNISANVKDKKLKRQLNQNESLFDTAQLQTAKAHKYLQQKEQGNLEVSGIGKTYNLQQSMIQQNVELGVQKKFFNLKLNVLGPYKLDLTRNGRYIVLAGRKGHLAMFDRQRYHLFNEVQVKETIRDVKLLHNEQFYATAQRKYVYIYDKRGIEVHCMRDHTDVRFLEFLPYHFLLCTLGDQGILRYQDTSTGEQVAEHRTKLEGKSTVMKQNPYNAVLCIGHAKGVVSMWTPNISQPVVKMLTHNGPVSSLAVDSTGHYLVSSGIDGQVKVWDVRTYKHLHAYFSRSPVEMMDISQSGMLAYGYGKKVQVWKDCLQTKAQSPYMNHMLLDGALAQLKFTPYEDFLTLGHSEGISNILIPGSGEAMYDTYVANPYENSKQRREQEVNQLLEKLQPDMIQLDPFNVGKVSQKPEEYLKERKLQEEAANLSSKKGVRKQRNLAKGRNKASKRYRKKKYTIIEERKEDIKEHKAELAQENKKQQTLEEQKLQQTLETVPKVLHRFYK